MKTFSLNVQQKVSVWQEVYVEVEATSVEEATGIISSMGSISEIMYEYAEKGKDNLISSIDYMFDTEEELTPEDNDGQSTFEIYLGDQPMYKNGE